MLWDNLSQCDILRIVEELFTFQTLINLVGMILLVIWSIVNIGLGIFKTKKLDKKSPQHAFWKMALMWNVVNLAIALFALSGIAQPPTDLSNIDEIIQTTTTMKDILFSNFILDWVYMFAGYILAKHGISKKNATYIGYGKSIIVQGLFLMLLDLVLFANNLYFLYRYV